MHYNDLKIRFAGKLTFLKGKINRLDCKYKRAVETGLFCLSTASVKAGHVLRNLFWVSFHMFMS